MASGRLRSAWLRFKARAEALRLRIASAQTTVLIVIGYFLVLGPIALIWRRFVPDPLGESGTGWTERPELPRDLESHRRQY